MPKIVTAVGMMDSSLGLKYILERNGDTNLLTNILTQLLEHSQTEATEAIAHILAHTRLFGKPLVKLAEKHRFAQSAAGGATAKATVWPEGLAEHDIQLLESVPELCYDESLFRAVCTEMERAEQADLWLDHITSPNTPMSAVLKVVPHPFRPMFAQKYVEQFKRAFV